ncbi:MAG TPA: hypothetical protein VFO81_05400 [Gaiellaceae bacterium]|nr:hypothetical protein [Gaiellaceae bacterium]
MRSLALALALPVAALAVLVASASAAGPVRATLATSSTKPVVGAPWRYTITVEVKGKPAAAKARLQILLGPTVVGCWKGAAMVQCQGATAGTWIPFRGRRTGVLTWPAQSAGVRLTFQAIVVAAGSTVRLRTPVTVQPAAATG